VGMLREEHEKKKQELENTEKANKDVFEVSEEYERHTIRGRRST
jgi:hypothetical protein